MPNEKFYDSLLRPIAEKVVDKTHAKYEADVAEWYSEGDGRPVEEGGHGYAYPECIHGASRWTDYDNICGPCEESLTREEEVDQIVKTAAYDLRRRANWMAERPFDQKFSENMVEALTRWALEPLTRLQKQAES